MGTIRDKMLHESGKTHYEECYKNHPECAQAEILKLKGQLYQLATENNRLKREAREEVQGDLNESRALLGEANAKVMALKEWGKLASCSWCGHVGEKNADDILEHVFTCEKNPTVKLMGMVGYLLERLLDQGITVPEAEELLNQCRTDQYQSS